VSLKVGESWRRKGVGRKGFYEAFEALTGGKRCVLVAYEEVRSNRVSGRSEKRFINFLASLDNLPAPEQPRLPR
jgi:hypothetical protein